ncbi:hypothetical protein CC80DRAFT_496681 [Byssothecium circinans]|uniref:DUF7053 domain-containing protein n=1 Tax=Byssothecium circinans TaxID=147558 RepID=A0A6A5TE69_9PLEO|nr:hypothetical protein CC80DRAFT_496681 [Byssothecium circinans]
MTLAKHNYHTAAPIPPHLTPADVISALHDHDTCLSLQALTTRHEKLPETAPEILKDTFWYPLDVHPIETYSVTEVMKYMPYFSWGQYNLTFPSHFQNTPHGLKTRADASGTVVRAEFRVIRGDSVDGEVDGEGQGLGDVEFVLVEDVEVTCSWYMMPVVRGKMEGAHRDICRKVVEKVIMEKTQADIAKLAAADKGKARAETPVLSQIHTPVRIHTPPVKRNSLGKRESGGSTKIDSPFRRESGTSSPFKRDSGGKPDSPLKMEALKSPANVDTSYRIELPEQEHTPVQPKVPETPEKTPESEEEAKVVKTPESEDDKEAVSLEKVA